MIIHKQYYIEIHKINKSGQGELAVSSDTTRRPQRKGQKNAIEENGELTLRKPAVTSDPGACWSQVYP